MRRKIKFRGKSVDEPGKWVYSSEVDFNNPTLFGDVVVDPKTVSQFTGCLDKEKNEIYECDVVSGLSYGDFLAGVDAECHPIVCWIDDYASFMLDCGARCYRDMRICDDVTVVGNIFDNPEYIYKSFEL